MGKRSKVILIFFLILIFGISGAYSTPITSEKCKKIENLETLNDVIFVPGSLLQNGKNSFLILFNHNEIRLYEEGLEEYTAKSFDEKIVSIQLLEENAPNIFLVATSNKIYFLDESLFKKDPLTFTSEIKKVMAIWNDGKVNYDLLIQYDKSVNCYSIDGEEEWEYLLNKKIMLLSTTENDEKIFGNTKNKIFIIDRNGYERTKKEFSEVFSVHSLSDGILIHCFDGEKYTLKRIEFNDPNEIKSLDPFDEPLNVVAVGRQYPNSNTELIYFQEANGTFHVIHKGGTPYIDPLQLDLIKKIIIEDLDGVLYYYDAEEVSEGKRGLKTLKENKNEFILVTENKIFICAVREELNIVEWEIKGLNSFFIPKEQPKKDDGELTTSRMAIYKTGDKICFGDIFDDYLWFWDRMENVKSKTIDEESYIIANEYLKDAKNEEDAIEFYKAQDIVQSWESFLNEKISESEQRAENYISQAEQEHENRNYVEACDMYYHAIEEYKKFKDNNEIKELCKQFLLCTNEIYKYGFIENYKFKIELFSILFKLFDLGGYVDADVIEGMEDIDDGLKEDLTNFKDNHLEAFESYLQDFEKGAKSDEENSDLDSAKEKYSTLVESYQLINQHLGKYHIEKGNIEKKIDELENKVSELDSKIQRQHVLYVGISVLVLLGIIYFWRYKKREPLQVEMEKEKFEEELTDEKKKSKMEEHKEEYKRSKEYFEIFLGFLAVISFLIILPQIPKTFNPIFIFIGIILIVFIVIYGLKLLYLRNQISPKEEIQTPDKEKSLRDFFVDPETGDPNFIVVVGDVFEQYIEPIKEFLKLISEEHFNYTEIIPMYLITEHLGKIKTGEREVTHFVEIDERSLELRDNEIKDVHKIGYNLLLIGFVEDNTLIKDLIDQGLSKIDWLYSDGDFEFIRDAFIEGKDAIICSGKDKDAISKGLRKLLEKLYEED